MWVVSERIPTCYFPLPYNPLPPGEGNVTFYSTSYALTNCPELIKKVDTKYPLIVYSWIKSILGNGIINS